MVEWECLIKPWEASGLDPEAVHDCGAVQRPPSAQVIGNLVRVAAEPELEHTPTGYIVRMREAAQLVKQDADHWLVEAV